jgi:hypothetical protein
MKISFTIEGDPFGSGDIAPEFRGTRNNILWTKSKAFCCPKCGRLWASAAIDSIKEWEFLVSICEKCPSQYFTIMPGSIQIEYEKEYQEALPREVLLREFWLALKRAEEFKEI